jgi:two-component system cell cycle sensor histidine kinase/response regulator CckA
MKGKVGMTRRPNADPGHDAQPQVATIASCLLHDFGNLLTLMGGHAELLARNAALDDNARDDVASIRSAVRRAMHLVSNWSDFLRPASSEWVVVPLEGLFREIEDLATPSLSSNVQLEIHFDRKLSVQSNYEHLQRAILNLVLNARDAVGRRGKLEITAEPCPRHGVSTGGVRITVKDSGSGISPEHLERIREPFFTTKKHGSGLGLPQVSEFVEKNGGTLEIRSELGAGSEFSMILARGPEVSFVQTHSEPPPSHQQGTILVVQRDETLCSLLRDVLKRAGYTVLVAAGAGDALLVLARFQSALDAVILDSDLTWMPVGELSEQIRQEYPSIPILVLTNSPACTELEADRVILKPFDAKTFAQDVCQLLTRRPQLMSETRMKVLPPRSFLKPDREKIG